jgi:competence protein ComEA
MGTLPDRPVPSRTHGERFREWVVWFGPGRLAVSIASAAAVVIGASWLLRTPPPPVEASLPYATTTTPATPATSDGAGAPSDPVAPSDTTPPTPTSPSVLLVHVAGAVIVPGVHPLPPDARVIDAITAAGGPAADAHTDALNLAEPLADGDRVYVPVRGEVTQVPVGVTPSPGSGGGAATGQTSTGPVDLNTAGVDALDVLPGVGPATAAAIVDHRERVGPFVSVDQLADVPGIGPAKLEALRDLVTV